MRVVMLNLDPLKDSPSPRRFTLQRVSRRTVVRMHIVNQAVGLELKQLLEVLDRTHVSAIRRIVIQIAQMMADDAMFLATQSEGRLELTTGRQDRSRTGKRQSMGR